MTLKIETYRLDEDGSRVDYERKIFEDLSRSASASL